jgi:hypothetical protein
VDELVVVREPLERQTLVCGPVGPVPIGPDALVAEVVEPAPERRDVLGTSAVENDLPTGDDLLRLEQPVQLRAVDRAEPGTREGNGARNVTSAGVAVRTPAVIGGERPDIDDRQGRIGQSPAELGGGDDLCTGDAGLCLNGHWGLPL